MNETAIILPAYNEELTIEKTIIDFYKEKPDLYFVVVDNNSSDNTNSVADAVLKKINANYIIIKERQQGKGFAVRRAFLEVDAQIYIMVDADSTYPADQIKTMIKLVELNEYDLVVGNRHHKEIYKEQNKRRFHVIGNQLVKKLINLIYNSNIQDVMSGYRVLSRQFVINFPILSPGFELETEMTLHALEKKFRICEVPIQYKERPLGSFSKLNTFSDGYRVIAKIFNIFRFYKPFLFFGSLSLLMLTLGLFSGSPVIYEYIKTGYITHIPLAILSTGLVLSSLISLSIGIILDSIIKVNNFNYQLQLSKFRPK